MANTLSSLTKTSPHKFWAGVINLACYICNRCLVRPLLGKSGYEVYHNKIPSISHFKVYGSKHYILYTKDQLGKFDFKNQNGIFLGKPLNSPSYRIYNLETLRAEESSDMIIDKVKITKEAKIDYDEEHDEVVVKTSTPLEPSKEEFKKEMEFHKDQLEELVIGSPSKVFKQGLD